MEHQVLAWITQYGYIAIYCMLVLGIIGLPVPDETLMTFTGYLVYQGHLSFLAAWVAAFLGSASGITVSYILGHTFGMALIHRYGKYLRIREEHVEKAHAWFQKKGHWSLTFGYFIPGVRHFTAYAAGMSGLEYPGFMVFAYSGAALWATTFITLGYLLGEQWQAVEKHIHQYLLWATIACIIAAAFYLVWRKRRRPGPR